MTLTRIGFCENGTFRNGFGAERRQGPTRGRRILKYKCSGRVPVLLFCPFRSRSGLPGLGPECVSGPFRAWLSGRVPVAFRSFPVLVFSGPFRSWFSVLVPPVFLPLCLFTYFTSILLDFGSFPSSFSAFLPQASTGYHTETCLPSLALKPFWNPATFLVSLPAQGFLFYILAKHPGAHVFMNASRGTYNRLCVS